MTSIIVLTICAFFTSVISAVVGMAGGIVLLSIMTFFLPIEIIVPIHGMVQLISNSTRTWFLRQHIRSWILKSYLLGLPIGVLLSIFIVKQIHSPIPFYLLISGIIFYTLFKPKKMPHFNIGSWGFGLLGTLSGLLSLLIGATGPLLAPFFLRDDLDKKNIIATKSSVQTFTHLLKVPAFLFLGFHYQKHTLLIASMTLAAVLGTKYGVHLLGKINEALFRKIFKTALFLAACRLLYKCALAVV